MAHTPLHGDDAELPQRLGQHIEALVSAGPRHAENPDGVSTALDYITSTLEGFGYSVEQEHYGDLPHETNLMVSIDPESQGKILEVGAHWDTVANSPGADDNASGVAGLLEIARALAGVRLSRPVRLCFFAEEETMGCRGSGAHVDRVVEHREPVEGAIILEMIGYRESQPGSQRWPDTVPAAEALALLPETIRSTLTLDTGEFIAAVGDDSAGEYVSALATPTGSTPALPVLPLLVPAQSTGNVSRSDHARYWAAGLAGVMVTDTAEFRNPHYHQPTDTPETLDLAFAAEVTQTVIRAVHRLAGSPH